MYIFFPKEASIVYANAQHARKIVAYDANVPGTGHNDASDAVRHAYWSALNARDVGEFIAISVGEMHEDEPNQPKEEREMDLYNNSVGVKIGTENESASNDQLYELVIQALDEGKLQVVIGVPAENPVTTSSTEDE